MYLRKLSLALLALALAPASALDCAKAKGEVDQAICGNEQLKALDGQLGSSYGQLRAAMSAGEFAALRRSQLQWLKERDRRCGTKVDCLSEEMQIRIAALDSVGAQMIKPSVKAKDEAAPASDDKATAAAEKAAQAAIDDRKARDEELQVAKAKEEAGDTAGEAQLFKKVKIEIKNSDDGSGEARASEDDDSAIVSDEAVSDGTASDGTNSDGTASDGADSDGTNSDGTNSNGTASDGTASDETAEDNGSAGPGSDEGGEAASGNSAADRILRGMKKKGGTPAGAARDGISRSRRTASRNSPLTPQEIYRRAAKSVVTITARSGAGQSLGSGVVLSKDVVATNCHVTNDGEDVMVHFAGERYPALASLGNDELDFCLLFTENLPATPAPIGTLAQVEPGAPVYSIGSPQGLKLTIANGLVSGLKEVEGVEMIQTSAPISQGSSGGGLFNEYGQVIGITTASLADGQNLNFALPAELAIQVAQGAVAANN